MKYIFIILFLFFPLTKKHFGQSIEKNILFSPENRLKFGNSLFNDHDYLRAIDEYEAYLKINSNDTLQFKIAYGYSQMNYSDHARTNYQKIFSSKFLSAEAKLFYLFTYFQTKEFDKFESELESIIPTNYKYSSNIQKQISFIRLLSEVNFSEEDIIKPFAEDEKSDVLNLYQQYSDPPYKSPTAAGIMSAIIPGSGKVYAGKLSDGIISFLLTGLFTYLAVDNFNKERNTRAWIFTGAAAFFYAGNIYGSVAAAQIYNAGIRFNFESEVEAYLGKQNYFMPSTDYLYE